MRIAVIDYGMGNIRSVAKALEKVGADVVVVDREFDPSDFDKFVLPGVGAFGDTVEGLKGRGLWNVVEHILKDGYPYLGICLGMQILCKASEESPGVEGFGIIPETVKRFLPSREMKVPHMGWNRVDIKEQDPVFDGIDTGAYFYFCHSFYIPSTIEGNLIIATTDYSAEFVSALRVGSAYGVQFHPEKSQSLGLRLLENFVQRC